MGATQRYTKWYVDLHTNLRGAGVTDPRLSKVIPARMSNIQVTDAGALLNYEWSRDKGVDVMYGHRRIYGALLNASVATANVAKNYTITNATDKAQVLAFFDQEGFPIRLTVMLLVSLIPKGACISTPTITIRSWTWITSI